MIMRFFDQIPGGRGLILLIPVLLFLAASAVLDISTITQIERALILVLSVMVVYVWRRSLIIYFTETEDAGAAWTAIGAFLVVSATVAGQGYTFALNIQPPVPDPFFISAVRFGWTVGFGALYLAGMSYRNIVPVRGWVWLGLSVVLTTAAMLAWRGMS